MSNPANYIALVAQCFLDDDVLSGLVDGQIVPGYRRALADDYLSGANRACIGVRTLNLRGETTGGSEYHGVNKFDQLIEISVTHKSDNDTYISSIMSEIIRIMTKRLTKTIGGVAYSVKTDGNINFTPVNDPAFLDRVEVTGTCRLKYLDT